MNRSRGISVFEVTNQLPRLGYRGRYVANSKAPVMRRFPKFSLQSLLVVVTLIALWFGYRAYTIGRIERAAKAIERDSIGLLLRKVDDPNAVHAFRSFSTIMLLGLQTQDRIRGVWIRECDRERYHPDSPPYDDETVIPLVKHMQNLPDMTELSLEGSPITSASMEHIAKLRGLTSLDVKDTRIDDTSVPYILKLPELTYLAISGSKISSDGRDRLQEGLPNCKIW